MTLPWLAESLEELRSQELLRTRRTVVPLGDGECLIDGRKLRNFASNDYLNLAHDPRVIAEAQLALTIYGAGSGASALVSGNTPHHEQLVEALAEFEGREAALLFPTGYAANVGCVTALVGQGDAVFCDRLNHASLVDGCRLSGASLRVYRHNELSGLERALQRTVGVRRRLIVSDGVFSMDGNAAPLVELADIAERHDAAILVDEAHGTGVFGQNGRGVCEELKLEHRVAVRMGTLSKALGSLGGFVTGSRDLIDWLWNSARTQMFSTALPASCCAAALAALDIVRKEPERRARLRSYGPRLASLLRNAGLKVPRNAEGPIIPVMLNDPHRALGVASQLELRGFLVGAIRPPTVPRGTSRLRITLSAAHSEDDVDALGNEVIRVVEAS